MGPPPERLGRPSGSQQTWQVMQTGALTPGLEARGLAHAPADCRVGMRARCHQLF